MLNQAHSVTDPGSYNKSSSVVKNQHQFHESLFILNLKILYIYTGQRTEIPVYALLNIIQTIAHFSWKYQYIVYTVLQMWCCTYWTKTQRSKDEMPFNYRLY